MHMALFYSGSILSQMNIQQRLKLPPFVMDTAHFAALYARTKSWI